MNGNEEIEKWWCFSSLIFPTSFSITAQQLQHACLRMDSRHVARKIVLSYSAPQTCRRTFLTPFRSNCSTPKWQEMNLFLLTTIEQAGCEMLSSWKTRYVTLTLKGSPCWKQWEILICAATVPSHRVPCPKNTATDEKLYRSCTLCFPLNVASTALNLTNSGGNGSNGDDWGFHNNGREQIKSLPWMSVAQTNTRWADGFGGIAAHSHGAEPVGVAILGNFAHWGLLFTNLTGLVSVLYQRIPQSGKTV